MRLVAAEAGFFPPGPCIDFADIAESRTVSKMEGRLFICSVTEEIWLIQGPCGVLDVERAPVLSGEEDYRSRKRDRWESEERRKEE